MDDEQDKSGDHAEPNQRKPRKPLTPEQRERRKAYLREYYQKNKESLSKRNQENEKANRKRYNGYKRKWVAKNRERVQSQGREHYARNREAYNAKMRAYKSRDDVRLKLKSWLLEKKYGIDITAFEGLIKSQEGKCKCCNTPFGLLRGLKPCVDHCHATGKIRGILCVRCNLLLGHANDQPEVLRNCAAYLERESGPTDGVVSLKPKNQRKKRGDDNEAGCVQRDLFSDSRDGANDTHGEVQAG